MPTSVYSVMYFTSSLPGKRMTRQISATSADEAKSKIQQAEKNITNILGVKKIK